MKTLITLLAACLIATSPSLRAETIKFPEKDPAFSFTLPDGWKATLNKKGDLECSVDGRSKFPIFKIIRIGTLTDEKMKDAMPKFMKIYGQSSGIENLLVSDLKETANAKKVKFLRMNGSGPTSEIEMGLAILAFAPRKDTYFLIMSGALASDKTHEQAIGEIVKSITPISGESEE